MKTFVITLSKAFMVGHPKDGMPTGFEDAIKDKRKIHCPGRFQHVLHKGLRR